jgi:hypothetical protein
MLDYPGLAAPQRETLTKGCVIPAHPLALDCGGEFDEKRQRALTRYFIASGAGGVAVGVHTTEFALHDPAVGMFEPVLTIAIEEMRRTNPQGFVKVAGLCGPTSQAVREAELARSLGYDLGLLSNYATSNLSESDLLQRAKEVAKVIPVFGFYLQPSVGGRVLSYRFWREFFEIPNVCAVKIAPFNRYETLAVVRAVCDAARDDVALYTGNDDNIVGDLLTVFRFPRQGSTVKRSVVGGLLGQWAVWTRKAVRLLENIHRAKNGEHLLYPELMSYGAALTDANGAIFDVAHGFKGCVAGIKEVLRRQGLLETVRCLDDSDVLSPGQVEEIDRIWSMYPFLRDDDFVAEHLEEWLR